MTTFNPRRNVLLIGKSRLVLDESVAGLRDLGYEAEGTNDFADITGRFDVKGIDLVVFGGQVPPDRKAELREEISAINPAVIFVQGLAGIPGLLAPAPRQPTRGTRPRDPDPRSRADQGRLRHCANRPVDLRLQHHHGTMTAWSSVVNVSLELVTSGRLRPSSL